jgi:hypothetical protein
MKDMDPSFSSRRNSRTLGAAAVVLVIVWVVLGSLGIWGAASHGQRRMLPVYRLQ